MTTIPAPLTDRTTALTPKGDAVRLLHRNARMALWGHLAPSGRCDEAVVVRGVGEEVGEEVAVVGRPAQRTGGAELV
jgi:hypothetical protein